MSDDKFRRAMKADKKRSKLLDEVMGTGEEGARIGRPKEFEELVKLNIHIPPDLKERFRTLTKKQGIPMAYVVRELIEAYVEKHTGEEEQ